MSTSVAIARTILAGFDKHYRLYRQVTAEAKGRFERSEWGKVWEAHGDRIGYYDRRVVEAVETVMRDYPEAADETLWREVKLAYITLLYGHLQPECAETFYNSVACRVLHRSYYHNEYIFWRPAVSTEHLVGDVPLYRCYYPITPGMRRTLCDIIESFGLAVPFENLERDVQFLLDGFAAQFPASHDIQANYQLQVVSSLFYRNKAAYVIGRVLNGNSDLAFAVPIRKSADGLLYLDALLFQREHIAALFSLARSYFMVDVEVPSALVDFLSALMPTKSRAELYTAIGLQKQGKTLFYRDLHNHLRHSNDSFVIAPGTKGMVMVVFTMPSFPYVFKMIRDTFAPPKDTSAKKVKEKYLLVKHHDRVGRMADTLEYSQVAFPVDRFAPELLDELRRMCPSILEFEGDEIVIQHLYIERRMIPLDLYLRGADEERMRHGIRECGNAIRELAAANIFPGDLLLKNFGVTRYGRVVFYDYDEICYLTECNFRRIPPPRDYDDEMSGEPWYSVGPNDIFPEEFPTFVFAPGQARQIFLELHGDLADADFWKQMQRRNEAGVQEDIFPYPHAVRFRNQPAQGAPPTA